MANSENNRLLALEQRLENRVRPSGAFSLTGLSIGMGNPYPGGKAWPGARSLPAANTQAYNDLSEKLHLAMVSFAKKYINKVSRSSMPGDERLDINRLGGYDGWLACKDFFVVTMIMAAKKMDIPFYFMAESHKNKELLYVSSNDGCSTDLIVRYSKMWIGFLKKYTEKVNRTDAKVGDIFLHIGGYSGATGHVRLVVDTMTEGGVKKVICAEGHRSPTNKHVVADGLPPLGQLPEFVKHDLDVLLAEDNLHHGGIVRLKWDLLWKDNAFRQFSSWTKVNRVKKRWKGTSTQNKMKNNEEFYKPVMKIIGSY